MVRASYHFVRSCRGVTKWLSSLVAFRTMIPSVVTAMQRIANSTDPFKFHYSAIAYKPFLSLFNMTGVVADGALPPAIGAFLPSCHPHARSNVSSRRSELRSVRRTRGPPAVFGLEPRRALHVQERH